MRRLLIIAAATLGLVWPASAGAAVVAFEGESMAVTGSGNAGGTDASAANGQTLKILNGSTTPTPGANGVATKTVSMPGGANGIRLWARGKQCSGAPGYQLKINGTVVKPLVDVTNASPYWQYGSPEPFALTPGGDVTVTISFVNDRTSWRCGGTASRDLFIDRVRLYGPDPALPTTTLTSWLDDDSPTDPRDEDGSGDEETTLTYSIANADSAQYALDGGAWTTASASGAPAAIVLPADGNDHALQLRARRTSDGAVDSTPASSTLKICPQAGCGAPPPTTGAFPRLGMFHYVIADDAQAEMLARWDWFTTSTADPGSVQRTPLVKSLNPGIKYVPYLDASEDNGWAAEPDCRTPTTTASGFRDEWFVRNADGSYATRSYSGSRKQLNITQFAQVVNGESWNDHLAAWVARCQVGVSDGTVLDLISDTGSGLWGAWSVAGVFSDQVDLDRNGEADRYESGKGNAWIDDQWGEGANLLISKVRAAVGNHPLVPSNGTGLNTDANGFIFEGGSTDDNGVNLFRTWMTDHYGSGEHMSLAITPAGLHGGTQTSYKLMRHNLGAAMLAGAYFGYADGNGPNGGYSSLWWYDEYSVDRTTGQATGDATAKGYLGLPTGDAVRAANGVWRRDFDNGIVLVNNTTSEQTTDLGGTFRRISGVQDPAHNDGASVTSQTLAGQDAIMLLR